MKSNSQELHIEPRSELAKIEEELRGWAENIFINIMISHEKTIAAHHNLSVCDYYRERLIDLSPPEKGAGPFIKFNGDKIFTNMVPSEIRDWRILELDPDVYSDCDKKQGIAANFAVRTHELAINHINAKAFSSAIVLLRRAEEAAQKASEFKRRIMPYEMAESIKAWNAKQTQLENDPKQRAKAYIKDCWTKGRANGTLSGRYKAGFAKKMLADPKCATLDSQPVIASWCKEWEKTSVS